MYRLWILPLQWIKIYPFILFSAEIQASVLHVILKNWQVTKYFFVGISIFLSVFLSIYLSVYLPADKLLNISCRNT